jgi:hypothetical protein
VTAETPNQSAVSADFEFAALGEARRYRAALVREFTPHLRGCVVEIGAGIGQMTPALARLPAVTELLSIEPDAGFCRTFRANLPGQPLLEGTIDAAPADKPWEGIVSINVLEHILHDEGELAAYRRLLALQRGLLCLFVPARPEIFAPIDRDFGHHRRYTRAGLAAKLTAAGFDIVRLRYFNFVGYFAWWLNFCVLKRRSFDVTAVRMFDRFIFPPTNQCETRVCPPPIGQSLLAVARAQP